MSKNMMNERECQSLLTLSEVLENLSLKSQVTGNQTELTLLL